MNFKDRLARLDPNKYASAFPGRRNADGDCSYLLPGRLESNACGSYWHMRTDLSPTHRHGTVLVGDLLKRNLAHLRYTSRRPLTAKIAPQNLLFMDTETTGLAGGTGTMAFLVGIGYFDHDHFVIEQYFVRRFAEERAVLGQFLNRLERTAGEHGALVTFNGKGYDLPLLHNRAVLQRFSHLPEIEAHIDLLYPSRRLWKKHLPDCTLKTLEHTMAGVIREGDVPAWRIPELYFRYLRTADPIPLTAVFRHNRLDILSMVALLDVMLMLFSREPAVANLPVDRISMARMVEEMDREEVSFAFYDKLMEDCPGEAERTQLMLSKARLYKRRRNYTEAARLWKAAINGTRFCPEAYEELARVYEHHLADLYRARSYTQRALEQIVLVHTLHPQRLHLFLKERLLQRLRRLNQKLQKKGMGGEQKAGTTTVPALRGF